MHIWRVALGCAAALTIVGCGSATKTVTVAQTTTVTATTPTTSVVTTSSSTTASSTGPRPCSQINIKTVPNGTRCNANGVLLKIAQQDASVHLKTLAAHVAGVSTADSLSGVVNSMTATGRFVIISLNITNAADSPQEFGRVGTQQTAIIGAHNRTYSEDFDAENGPDQHSCVANDNPIQPGGTITCDVVYDIPSAAVTRARTHGLGLLVANFGDDLSPNSVSAPTSAALIVLRPLGSA